MSRFRGFVTALVWLMFRRVGYLDSEAVLLLVDNFLLSCFPFVYLCLCLCLFLIYITPPMF